MKVQKVQSVNDAPGQIISISNSGDVGHAASRIGAAGIVPQPGQTCERVELSEELGNRSLPDLLQEFRVVMRGGQGAAGARQINQGACFRWSEGAQPWLHYA